MSTSTSSTTDGKQTSSGYSHHSQNAGNLYSFSVHQPYTNWPIHGSHTTPYAPSWYSHPIHPAQSYTTHKTYREQATQAPDTLNGKGKERDTGEQTLKFAKQWDTAFITFFKRVGLLQTLAGFKEDMLLLNEDWEREQIPGALDALVKDIKECTENANSTLPKKTLEERKIEHIPAQQGVEVQTPSTTVRSVSRLLRESRKRSDASNRTEFLLSVAEKRRRLNELGEAPPASVANEGSAQAQTEAGKMDVDMPIASCARADAKYQDRDTQMKYDIVKNEDGPLKRTVKRTQADGDASAQTMHAAPPVLRDGAHELDAKNHPGLAARMETIEDHLGVRFVPSWPRSLLDRLKFLEDYIIRLEKDYPPWAALHFTQPNRGWPPPPRSTPIIVPPHLASPDSSSYPSTPREAVHSRSPGPTASIATSLPVSSKPGSAPKAKSGPSSLHRAVMERLEIKRAMGDLAGGNVSPGS